MDGKAFPRAMGVIFRHFQDGITKTHTVFARHEIIVSAGVVGSAHLLLLSGIGPKKQLQKHGVMHYFYFLNLPSVFVHQ